LNRFEGEDLSYKQRMVDQTFQKRAWWDAQIKEKQRTQAEYAKVYMLNIFSKCKCFGMKFFKT